MNVTERFDFMWCLEVNMFDDRGCRNQQIYLFGWDKKRILYFSGN